MRHVLAIGLTVAFILLGRWQWHRAESGNGLSWAYAIEWPLFAAFVVFFWWKMVHFELNPPPEQEREVVVVPEPVVDEEPDEELAAYNRYLKTLYEQDRKQS